MTTANNQAATHHQLEAPPSYYETDAFVPPDHHLVLDIPATIPSGPVRLAIIYQSPAVPTEQGLKELILAMPDVGTDEDFARRQDKARGSVAWDS